MSDLWLVSGVTLFGWICWYIGKYWLPYNEMNDIERDDDDGPHPGQSF